jgi:hypothetical protein
LQSARWLFGIDGTDEATAVSGNGRKAATR